MQNDLNSIKVFHLIIIYLCYDFGCSVTPSLLSDSSDVRAAGLRAIRHCIKKPEDITSLVRLRLTILICR